MELHTYLFHDSERLKAAIGGAGGAAGSRASLCQQGGLWISDKGVPGPDLQTVMETYSCWRFTLAFQTPCGMSLAPHITPAPSRGGNLGRGHVNSVALSSTDTAQS